jgi:hypothetical protein
MLELIESNLSRVPAAQNPPSGLLTPTPPSQQQNDPKHIPLFSSLLRRFTPHALHPSESSAAAATASTSIAALMAGHVLRDGELVLLILRPSRWFILLSSLRFLAIVAIFAILASILDDRLVRPRQYLEVGLFLMAGRLMWAILQWMGRYYILTDMRIVRLTGVFNVDIFDCPLRRVARTLLEATFKERLCRIGSIIIIPQDDQLSPDQWQMVSRPRQIHEQILAAIARAKQGGLSPH